MNTILVPTDFSAPAKHAADYAAQLAKTLGASIHLLHAYMVPTPVAEMPYMLLTADELYQENETLAKAEAERLQQQYGVTVSQQITIGIPSEEIRYYAEQEHPILIVMGMQGDASGLDKWLGSTATATIRKAPVPTLIVPASAPYKSLFNITLATDFQFHLLPSQFKGLAQLIQHFQALTYIVHVQAPGKEINGSAVSAKKELELHFEKLAHEYHVVENEKVEDGLRAFLSTHPSQLLVMIAHKHTILERFFGKSYTASMAFQTEVPLLVLQG